jgi:hypothetical protein
MSHDILEYKIINIEPEYNFNKISGGFFRVYFEGLKEPFKLSFVPFLERELKSNDELYSYVEKHFSEKTVSDVIRDLYELGYPLEEKVENYIKKAAESVDLKLFNQLLRLFHYMRDFGGESSGSSFV